MNLSFSELRPRMSYLFMVILKLFLNPIGTGSRQINAFPFQVGEMLRIWYPFFIFFGEHKYSVFAGKRQNWE